MKIEVLEKEDEKKWDEFVLSSEKATFCHLLGWRNVIKKSYCHQDLYLVAKEGQEIKGILPAFIIKNFFFGKKIISLPFHSYGGITTESREAEDLLINYLKKHTKENKYDFFELRSTLPGLDLSTDLSQFSFLLKLDPEEDIIWGKIDKKVRNQIRKANKFDLKMRTGSQYLDEFYKLYQINMRRLGTPVHGFSFFENIIKEFPSQARIFTVKFKNKSIASLFLFNFKDRIANLWAASDYIYSRMNPNDYLYWEAIKQVAKEGFNYFDFGRSQKESGAFNFKKQWGTNLKPLFYQYYSSKRKNVVLDKEKYGKISKIWRRTPLIITNKIGPRLRKFIP